jgi:predicted metal-dependent phosphoesterase TrpH
MAEIIRIDMHCHSSASDGDHSPGYVAHQLAGAGVVWAALADHNTVGGQEHFRAAVERRGMHYVSAVEIHARSETGPVHLLAYGFDVENQALLSALEILRRSWLSSTRRRISRIFSGGKDAGTPSVADPPGDGDPPRRRPPDTAESIRLIHEAGGHALLAHPLAGLKTVERLEEYLDWLQPQGLDGIEAFYKLYFRSTQQLLLELAEQRGLLTVGGSDFHGLHHSDGTSPGVEMPVYAWDRFASALGLPQAQSLKPEGLDGQVSEVQNLATSSGDGLPVSRGYAEN